MINQPQLLSNTLVTQGKLQLSAECREMLYAELASMGNATVMLPDRQMFLKMIYQFNSLDNITETFFHKLKAEGYHGVEINLSCIEGRQDIIDALNKYGLSLILRIVTNGDTVERHIDSFQVQLLQSIFCRPFLINSVSGADYWGMDEKSEFIAAALELEQAVGVTICHQLHRGSITYSPWETRDLLLSFPGMKISCDFSAWVTVCGRLLTGEMDIIKLCAERCLHISTRICDEQGFLFPSIDNPRYDEYLKHYEKWWNLIWLRQYANGLGLSTMSHSDPLLIQRQVEQPGSNSYSAWMNERQSRNFNGLFPLKKNI